MQSEVWDCPAQISTDFLSKITCTLTHTNTDTHPDHHRHLLSVTAGVYPYHCNSLDALFLIFVTENKLQHGFISQPI